jgi:protein-tyrosine phosphatase
MSTTDVYWIPGPWRGRLGIVPRPRGGDWLADEIRSWRAAGLNVVTSLLTPGEVSELELQEEGDLARAEGVEFHVLPIPDLGVPGSRADFSKLIGQLEKALRDGKNVAIHCRQGIGRSSLVAASLLVSAGEDSNLAFRKIAEVRGRPVPETTEQRDWIADMAAVKGSAA